MISFAAFAQDKVAAEQLLLSFGRSKHFTGDVPGFFLSAEYAKQIKSKLNFHVALTATIHDDVTELFYTYPWDNTIIDGSIRNVTAAFQVEGLASYAVLKAGTSNLSVAFGPLLRYQSSSLANATGITYPAATGWPIPLIDFKHTDPMRTLAVGASLQLRYQYHLTKKFSVGLLAGYQLDSNGDNVVRLGITLARRF